MTTATKPRGDWTRKELCELIEYAERLHSILDDGIRKRGSATFPPKSNTAAWYRGDVGAALLELTHRIMPDCFHLRFTPRTPRRVYESLELFDRATDELSRLGFMRTDDTHVPDVPADVFTWLECGIALLREHTGDEGAPPPEVEATPPQSENVANGESGPPVGSECLYIFRKVSKGLGEAAFGNGKAKPVKWTKPIEMLHYLLRRPGETVAAIDVVGGKKLNETDPNEMPNEKAYGDRLDAERVWTAEAERNVNEKLAKLEADMRESVEAGDRESLERESAEYEKLKAMKSAAMGKHGKLRKAMKEPEDKASATVRQYFPRAIKQLESEGHHQSCSAR